MKPVLLDTGVIVALLDRRERNHKSCLHAIEDLERPLVTCEAVITESCYLLRKVHGAPEAILANVQQGVFRIPFDLTGAAAAVQILMRKYQDAPIDFADACLICLADQLDTGDIFTLDSDFTRYRWRRSKKFELLVPLEG